MEEELINWVVDIAAEQEDFGIGLEGGERVFV